MNKYSEEEAISIMKQVMRNLREWLNTPNDDLENMMGISWMQFLDVYDAIGEEE